MSWLTRRKPRRWQLILSMMLLISGGAWLFHRYRQTETPPSRARPHTPQVGAFAFKDLGAGEADFAMQTHNGRFKLRAGSRDFNDMPYGFPFYPGARLIGSANISDASPAESGRFVRFATSDPPERVAAFYRRQAQAAMLRIVTDQRLDGMAVLTGLYPDGRDGGFQLSARRNDRGETEATLSSGFGQDVTIVPQPDPELANLTDPGNGAPPPIEP